MPWRALLDRLALVLLALAIGACGDDPPPRPGAATPAADPEVPAAGPAPAQPVAAGVAWTHERLLRRLRNRRIRVDGRIVRVDRTTIVCTGIGRPAKRRRGEGSWTRFRCVQPTFPKRSVAGPDALFVVVPTGSRSLEVTRRRLSSY